MKSKGTAPPRINDSPDDGWVERQVIRHAFTVLRSKIANIPHIERWPVRREFEEHLDAAEQRILAKSKGADEILHTSPILRRPGDIEIDQRAAFEARRAAIKART